MCGGDNPRMLIVSKIKMVSYAKLDSPLVDDSKTEISINRLKCSQQASYF